jgi:hypothetical protein
MMAATKTAAKKAARARARRRPQFLATPGEIAAAIFRPSQRDEGLVLARAIREDRAYIAELLELALRCGTKRDVERAIWELIVTLLDGGQA